VALFEFNLKDKDLFVYDDEYISIVSGQCFLRSRDVSGQYTWPGEKTDSTITTFDYTATGLVRFIGLQLVGSIPTGTDVKMQVSVDAGATYMRWNGSTWIDDGLYSTIQEVASNLNAISFNVAHGKKIRFRLKLFTDTTKVLTPTISCIALFVAIDYSLLDDIKRSLRRFLVGKVGALLEWYTKTTASQSIFNIATNYSVVEVTGAFNKTQDPYLVNNLLASWTPGSPAQVTTTTPIPAGEYFFVTFKGHSEIIIANQEEFLFPTEKPHILIVGGNTDEIDGSEHYAVDEYDLNTENNYYESTPFPIYMKTLIELYAIDTSESLAVRMNESLWESLRYTDRFPSLATGENYVVLGKIFSRMNDMVKTGIRVKKYVISIGGTKAFNRFNVVPRVDQVILSQGDFNRKYSEVVIS